jgi:hypothetical protein
MKNAGTRPAALRQPGLSAGRLAKLHDAFLGKLRNDRVRLTIIAARLSRGGETARAFVDIRSLAQGVGAAAATFGAADVGTAARALERAVDAVPVLHSNNSDVDVWAALETLRDLLGSVGGVSRAL